MQPAPRTQLRPVVLSLVSMLLGSSACTKTDPHLQFCRRASLCENLALLMDVESCASQLPKALRGHDVDCRSCLMSLSCEGLGTALNTMGEEEGHKDKLRTVCAACDASRANSARGLRLDEPSTRSYRPLIPGLIVRGTQGAGQGTVASLCARIDSECATSQLLISTTQCTEQLSVVLDTQPRPCLSCVTALNCEGVGRLARDEAQIERLCPYCSADIDQSCGAEGCEEGMQTYFILPGIVPKTPDQKPALRKLLAGEPLGAPAAPEPAKPTAAAEPHTSAPEAANAGQGGAAGSLKIAAGK